MTRDARVLAALRAAEIHVPPGELSVELGLSRASVDEAIEGLRGAGFDIEHKPGLGCRLLGSPARLVADDVWSRLAPQEVFRELLVFQETASTNDVAARLGRTGHPGGIVIFAERQTAGRGRFGRVWNSAEGEGLWFSLLLRPALPVANWARLTTWAGVAVAAAIEQVTQLTAQIKWPNDVLVSGKKVAGILLESAVDEGGKPFVVVGIGVNVNQTEWPPELAGKAASLAQLKGRALNRAELAATILQELARLTSAVEQESIADLVADAARRSAVLGQWLQLRSGMEVIEGQAEALDGEGHLLLRLEDGSTRRLLAGEVTSQSAS